MIDTNKEYIIQTCGQSNQQSQMLKPLKNVEIIKETVEMASDITNQDVAHLVFEADKSELKNSHKCQIALFTTQLALYKLAKQKFPGLKVVGGIGHSVGICSIATMAEVFSEKDGFRLINLRGEGFSMVCKKTPEPTTLSAVKCRKEFNDKALSVLESFPGISLSLHNLPDLITVGGIENAMVELDYQIRHNKKDKAFPFKKLINLEVEGAYHTDHFTPVSEMIRCEIGGFHTSSPIFPLFMGTAGKMVLEKESIIDFLSIQPYMPELHVQTVRSAYKYMKAQDKQCNFLEITHKAQPSGWNSSILKSLIKKEKDAGDHEEDSYTNTVIEVTDLCA